MQRSFALDGVVVLDVWDFESSCGQGEAALRASRHVQHLIDREGDGQERVLRKGSHRFLRHVDCHWSVQLDNNSAVNATKRPMVGAPGGHLEFTRIKTAPTTLPKKVRRCARGRRSRGVSLHL